MPGKALAAAVALALLSSLLGCGGGEGDSSAPAATGSPNSDTAKEGSAKLEQYRDRVRRVQEGRQRQASANRAEGAEPAPPPSAPKIVHHDSGGGAAQFRSEGDNSIEEYGSEGSRSEREAAATALHGFFDSRAAHRWSAACYYASASLIVTFERVASLSRRGAEGKECPEILAALSSGRTTTRVLKAIADADVASLRVEGKHGFVIYRDPHGDAYVMPMVREAGGWKVAALGAGPLP